MKILIINSGSSSVKFQVFDMANESRICRGIIARIGTKTATTKFSCEKVPEFFRESEILDHHKAIENILEIIIDPEYDILHSMKDISVIGHRVVHGGEYFSGSVLLSDAIMEALTNCIELAPLHNPPNILGIQACQELLPDIPQVCVFDTAFHQTMPDHAYLYGLPYSLYEKYKIRRYGFHGTSHQYAGRVAADLAGEPLESLKIITCHLGNGASITAIKGGISIDTSMGFTPLEGLIMGTRCGDLDPAIIPYLIDKEDLSVGGVTNLMNKHSGVYGLAGLKTGDMYDLEMAEVHKNDKRAKLARDIYAYRVKKYIGAYSAALGGLDVLVFTGGVGENDAHVRRKILKDLDYLGISIDEGKNESGDDPLISKGRVKIFVVKADEELVIAREAKRLTGD